MKSPEQRSASGDVSQLSDIDDTVAELEQFPHLRATLADCDRILSGAYHEANTAAQRHQRHHHRLTLIAMLCGTAAVLFAILQLAKLFDIPWLKKLELIAALAAVTAVILGLLAARRSQWLLYRHRAERCRLLKFRFFNRCRGLDRRGEPCCSVCPPRKGNARTGRNGSCRLAQVERG